MERIKRAERLGAITRILTERPNRIHSYAEFCEMFGTAKSSISEDIDLIADSVARWGNGLVETIAGAAGGVRFRAAPDPELTRRMLNELCVRLAEPERALPGGFLYTSDLSGENTVVSQTAEMIAAAYYGAEPDLVLTMETKGIPLAMMTAHMMDVPLVIARHDSRAYEGSAVKINYLSGNGRDLETMTLARRSLRAGQRVLIVDDFMKGGGTLRGMQEMMREFGASIVGTAVLIARAEAPIGPLDVHPLLILEGFDPATGGAVVRASDFYTNAG